jgi:hypothetical protein
MRHFQQGHVRALPVGAADRPSSETHRLQPLLETMLET